MAECDRKAEEDIYRLCSVTEDVTQINIAKGDEYIHNSRGEKLFVRTQWPADGRVKAVLVSLHGYSSHCSRPTQTYVASKIAGNGVGYVCLDFHGHGYSDGLKGLVTSAEGLIDDVQCLLVALYSKILLEFHGEETDSVKRFHLNNYAMNVPLFILGQSMGGSTSLMVGDALQKSLENPNADKQLRSVAANFCGCILLCPALQMKVPSPVVVNILNYVIVPLFGQASIPEFIQPSNANQAQIWKNQAFIDYVERDGFPANPKGLSFKNPIRFQTGSSILKLAINCRESMSGITFPFLIFHDPDDRVVQFEGTTRLMSLAKTEDADKSLIIIENSLHDLLTNEMVFVVEKSLAWMEARLALRKIENKDTTLSSDD